MLGSPLHVTVNFLLVKFLIYSKDAKKWNSMYFKINNNEKNEQFQR